MNSIKNISSKADEQIKFRNSKESLEEIPFFGGISKEEWGKEENHKIRTELDKKHIEWNKKYSKN